MSNPAQVSKVHLVNEALKGLDVSVKYRVSPEVATFLSAQVKNLTILNEPLPDGYSPKALLAVIEDAEVEFDDLSEISESLRDEVIRLWSYKLTRKNLRLAVSKEHSISLDAIRLANEDVYNYVLANLSMFVRELEEEDVTMSQDATVEESVAILNDVVAEAPKDLAEVLDRAAPAWRVPEIVNVDVIAWSDLAKRSRFPASYQNVRLYRDEIGIDESIAKLLTAAKKIERRDQTEDEEIEAYVVALAQDLIAAKNVIPNPSSRVLLADSLRVNSYLALPDPLEAGSLAGLMIERDLIEDSLETFLLLVNASADWTTMELAISKSKKYKEFVSVAVLHQQAAVHLLESQIISDDVKRVIVDRSSEFLDQTSHRSQQMLAKEAVRLKIQLPIDVIYGMAAAQVNAVDVLSFLTPLLSSLDLPQLARILTALGGDYAKLAARSYNRPKFSRGPHIEALVYRLNELGIISSVDDKGSAIRVNMRHP